MKRSMAWALAVGAIPGMASAKTALGADQAAVIGAWQARSAPGIIGLVLEPVSERDGCARLTGEGRVELDDHPDVKHGLFWKAHRVKPGRYAVVAVRWGAGGYPTIYFGQSRQTGLLWTFTVAPAVVTDIGVWRVTSRYSDHYVVEGSDMAGSQAAALAIAQELGPLVTTDTARRSVAEATGPCAP